MMGLFPETTTQMTTQSSNTHKYIDTSSTFSESQFRGFASSDQCVYSSHPYGDLPHTHSIPAPSHSTSEKIYQRDTCATTSAYSTSSETLPHGMFQHQQMQHSYGDSSQDSKLNINVNIYQSQQLPQAHAHSHQLEDAAMLRRSDSRQTGRYSAYTSYGQPFYGTTSVLQGTDRQGMQSMDTGYQVMGRSSIFHSDLPGAGGRHFGRRPSLTIPMPSHTPER